MRVSILDQCRTSPYDIDTSHILAVRHRYALRAKREIEALYVADGGHPIIPKEWANFPRGASAFDVISAKDRINPAEVFVSMQEAQRYKGETSCLFVRMDAIRDIGVYVRDFGPYRSVICLADKQILPVCLPMAEVRAAIDGHAHCVEFLRDMRAKLVGRQMLPGPSQG